MSAHSPLDQMKEEDGVHQKYSMPITPIALPVAEDAGRGGEEYIFTKHFLPIAWRKAFIEESRTSCKEQSIIKVD